MSSQELSYYLWGGDATARIIRVRAEHSAYEDREGDWRVSFEFHNPESQKAQKGFSILEEAEAKKYSRNQEVAIEYYSDSPIGSRLKGQSNRLWVYLFVASIVLTIFSVVVLTWHGILEERRLDNRKWWIK